jgi:K+-transporting ATPase ATPase A chain
MTAQVWITLIVLVAALVVATRFLGSYLADVYGGAEAAFDSSTNTGAGTASSRADRIFGPVERLIYRVCGIDERREQRWTTYAAALLAFSAVSVLFVYAIQRLQGSLPGNPNHVGAVGPALSWNTAVSFVTNTNWQNYSGESTMSHLTQMAALTVQNFASAAVGLAVAVALIRGLVRRRAGTIGNFWVDLTRSIVRVLLPGAVILAVIFVSQGVIQNLHGFTALHTLQHGIAQHLPGGPVASQEAIKMFGTNGGGFFNANSAHPFENPNGFTNLVQIFALLVVPFALTYAFGKLVKDQKQGWVIFAAMFVLWIGAAGLAMGFETQGNKALTKVGADQRITAVNPIGNGEGKETRFGSGVSALYASSTTGTSTGAIDASHDSLTPAAGGVAFFNMMLGEVSPGGVGSGLYTMLIFVLLAVFIAGLMVGRTPEYLGKKIQAAEMKLAVLFILAAPIAVLVFSAIAIANHNGLHALTNHGPHGLTELVYGYTSASNNNGSAFAGLSANTPWFNVTLGVAMLVGRFLLIVPALAIAGSLARKTPVPASEGTFPTGTPLFGALLVGTVLIVVGLTYFPVLALGPIVEHLSL